MRDALGNVRTIVNGSASLLESRLYSPYGETYGTTGSSQITFGFTGEQTDSNGLVNLRARYYSPTIGQFLNLDPLETANRYSYVDGNPVNAIDPSGFMNDLSGGGGSFISVSPISTGAAAGCYIGGLIGSVLGIGYAAGCALGAGIGVSIGVVASTPAGAALVSSVGSTIDTIGNLAMQARLEAAEKQHLEELKRRKAQIELARRQRIKNILGGSSGKVRGDFDVQTQGPCIQVVIPSSNSTGSPWTQNQEGQVETETIEGFVFMNLAGSWTGDNISNIGNLYTRYLVAIKGGLAFIVDAEVTNISGAATVDWWSELSPSVVPIEYNGGKSASFFWSASARYFAGHIQVGASGEIQIRKGDKEGTCTYEVNGPCSLSGPFDGNVTSSNDTWGNTFTCELAKPKPGTESLIEPNMFWDSLPGGIITICPNQNQGEGLEDLLPNMIIPVPGLVQ